MALFTTNRYWGEDAIGQHSVDPLDHLRQLVRRREEKRAAERLGECLDTTGEDTEANATCPVKRKKRLHRFGREEDVTQQDGVSDSKKEREQLTEKGELRAPVMRDDRSSSLEEQEGWAMTSRSEELATNDLTMQVDSQLEGSFPESPRIKHKKHKNKSDRVQDGEAIPSDKMKRKSRKRKSKVDEVKKEADHSTHKEELETAESSFREIKEETMQDMELEEGRQEDETAEHSDATNTLVPITQLKKEDRPAPVRRHLPQWILHPHIVEADIQQHSRPLSDFTSPAAVLRNLQRMGISQLFPVQAHVVPELMSSLHGPLLTCAEGTAPSDVCVCAPTGCGKTLCYVVPIVSALLDRVVCQVRAIAVLPSHELAVQVFRVFEQVAQGTKIRTGLVCGHDSVEHERELLSDRTSYPLCSKVDVVVATPGRLVEHLAQSSFATLRHLRFLVIDEADKLLDQQFQEWLPKLLDAIQRDRSFTHRVDLDEKDLAHTLHSQCSSSVLLSAFSSSSSSVAKKPRLSSSSHPSSRPLPNHLASMMTPHLPLQKLLFSATMTQNPEHLSLLNLHQPKLFAVATSAESADGIPFVLPPQLQEYTVRCSLAHKPLVLLHLLVTQELSRVLCFTNSRETTHRLYLLIQHFDLVSVAEMSSKLSANQRRAILDKFRRGKLQVLISSDNMARGMDVEHISCVVNYELPAQFRTYLHRVGRTARARERGAAYALVAHEEVRQFNQMLKSVGKKKLEEFPVSPSDLQPFLGQYEQALVGLRNKIRHEKHD